jgi:hypothetical protein
LPFIHTQMADDQGKDNLSLVKDLQNTYYLANQVRLWMNNLYTNPSLPLVKDFVLVSLLY